MKRKPRLPLALPSEPAQIFWRGFVAVGLLSAFQRSGDNAAHSPPQVLGRALQGGTALGAAAQTMQALRRQDYLGAGLAVAGGAAGIALVEKLLFNHAESKE